MSRDGINYDADYYATLEVGMDASLDEIKDAYRRLAKIHHPDMNKGSSESTMRFKAINEAFGVLISPEKRNRYNITYRGVKNDVVVPIKKKKSKEERVKDSEFNFTIDVEVGEVDLWEQTFVRLKEEERVLENERKMRREREEKRRAEARKWAYENARSSYYYTSSNIRTRDDTWYDCYAGEYF